MGWGGAEVQVLYTYDQITQETKVFFYTGGTLGPSIGIPVYGSQITGVSVFNGPIDEIAGWSFGVQGAAGVAVGYAITPSGYSMVQIDAELGISAEFTFGVTFGLNDVAVVDWEITVARLARIYADNPEQLQMILAELALAKSVLSFAPDFIAKYGDMIAYAVNQCFTAGTPISLWDGFASAIEDIRAGDVVKSCDKSGNIVPGRVVRTFTSSVMHVLDWFGLGITPGHVTLCGDGQYAGQHVPMIDILRSDGALVKEDGSLVRAASGCPVGSKEDGFVSLIVGQRAASGDMEVVAEGQVRIGTRFILSDGRDVSMADLLKDAGAQVRSDCLIECEAMLTPGPTASDLPERAA